MYKNLPELDVIERLTNVRFGRHYYPEADPDDWVFIPAGVRAQIIKKDPKTGSSASIGRLQSWMGSLGFLDHFEGESN